VVTLTVVVGFAGHDTETDVPPRVDVPTFEVDPFWPKPLDYPFVLGSVFGVTIDARNNLFVVHGGNATLTRDSESGAIPNAAGQITGQCCKSPLQIIQYDTQGNKVREFGGPSSDYTFPSRPWGIAVDADGNVWIGGAGGGSPPLSSGGTARAGAGGATSDSASATSVADTRLLKFGPDGRFMREFSGFTRPTGIAFSPRTNEAFVADSLRIAVIDLVCGEL
jgi:DNA-binding beta-propeller fold protein YncE